MDGRNFLILFWIGLSFTFLHRTEAQCGALLQKYGYLASGYTAAAEAAAIAEYETFYTLPLSASGATCLITTLDHLLEPRCGTPDVTAPICSLPSAMWTVGLPADLTVSQAQALFTPALNLLNAAGFSLSMVLAGPDIAVIVGGSIHPNPSGQPGHLAFDGPGGVYGHAFPFEFHFDMADLAVSTPADNTREIAHLILDSLGFPHSGDPASVFYPLNNRPDDDSAFTLTPSDLAAIMACIATTTVPPTTTMTTTAPPTTTTAAPTTTTMPTTTPPTTTAATTTAATTAAATTAAATTGTGTTVLPTTAGVTTIPPTTAPPVTTAPPPTTTAPPVTTPVPPLFTETELIGIIIGSALAFLLLAGLCIGCGMMVFGGLGSVGTVGATAAGAAVGGAGAYGFSGPAYGSYSPMPNFSAAVAPNMCASPGVYGGYGSGGYGSGGYGSGGYGSYQPYGSSYGNYMAMPGRRQGGFGWNMGKRYLY